VLSSGINVIDSFVRQYTLELLNTINNMTQDDVDAEASNGPQVT
jgi:hypothetical protein